MKLKLIPFIIASLCHISALYAEDLKSISLEENVIENLGLSTSSAQQRIAADPIQSVAKLIIDPSRIHSVSSFFSGQIQGDNIKLGQEVIEGQRLSEMKSKELAEVISNFLVAHTKSEIATTLYLREKELRSKKLTTADALMKAEMEYKEARAFYRAATQAALLVRTSKELELLTTENELSDQTKIVIKSPLTGVIVEKNCSNGSAVSENELLYKVADITTLLIEIKLPAKAISYAKIGDEIHFHSLLGDRKKGSAKISMIRPTIEPNSNTLKVYAELDNTNNQWVAGSMLTAYVSDSSKEKVSVVPASAVIKIDGESHIFVEKSKGEYLPILVEVGQRSEVYTEIISELPTGSKIVSKGASLLLAAWSESNS